MSWLSEFPLLAPHQVNGIGFSFLLEQLGIWWFWDSCPPATVEGVSVHTDGRIGFVAVALWVLAPELCATLINIIFMSRNESGCLCSHDILCMLLSVHGTASKSSVSQRVPFASALPVILRASLGGKAFNKFQHHQNGPQAMLLNARDADSTKNPNLT